MKLLLLTLFSLASALVACSITFVVVSQGGTAIELNPVARTALELNVAAGTAFMFSERVLIIGIAHLLAWRNERYAVLVYLAAALNFLDAANDLAAVFPLLAD